MLTMVMVKGPNGGKKEDDGKRKCGNEMSVVRWW